MEGDGGRSRKKCKGNGQIAEFDSLIVPDLANTSKVAVEFYRPIYKNGEYFYDLRARGTAMHKLQQSSTIMEQEAAMLREVQTKNKSAIRVDYVGGWMPGSSYGPSSELYLVLDNGHYFEFVNHNLMSLEQFLTIIDSFKIKKCIKYCNLVN